MKRGFPQYLHQPRMDEIRKTWLTHSVPSFVARKMEALLFVPLPPLSAGSRPRLPSPRPLLTLLPLPCSPLLRSDGGGWMSF